MIQQAAESLRLLRLRLTGGRDAPGVVRRQAAAAVAGLLGRDAPLLQALDADSAVRLVRDPRRVALWAGLLDVEAGALRLEGDAASAAARTDRAAALRSSAGLTPNGADDPEAGG
jgi:hypothetical protein